MYVRERLRLGKFALHVKVQETGIGNVICTVFSERIVSRLSSYFLSFLYHLCKFMEYLFWFRSYFVQVDSHKVVVLN